MESTTTLHIVQGATTSDGSLPPFPTTPVPCVPVAFVYLSNMSATVTEGLILDARVILTASDAAAHNLLSATHGDTLAASVVAGDIVIGNDTPKWSRLAITVPAANVRNVLGVDNGETKPSWKTALDATTPADIAGTAGAGTSLVFPHRDHVHRGVVSVNKNGGATLYGAVTLSEGANITLTQAGQDIAIAATGSALGDPGSNGIVKRTALNTTTVAAAADVTSLFSGAGDYLKSDGTKGTPAGAGDVVGPAGATDGHLAVFDGATGKLLKDGGAVPAGGGGDFLVMQVFS